MQALIDRVYVSGGHDGIDYSQPADPPLAVSDAEWVVALLAQRKR